MHNQKIINNGNTISRKFSKNYPDGAPGTSDNHVVLVRIMSKEDNVYRILVEGSVYETNLPVVLNSGESFIAKMKSVSPLVLQMDDLLDDENQDIHDLYRIVEKLGAAVSDNSIFFLKELIKNKVPVIKSKFSRLVKLIDASGINMNDQESKALPLLFWQQDNFVDLSESNIRYFRYSIEYLHETVFKLLFDQKEYYGESEGISELCGRLTIDHETAGGTISDIFKKFAVNDPFLSEWVKNHIESPVKKERSAAKLLFMILFQKKLYKRMGLSPEFMVRNKNGRTELIQYKVKKSMSNRIAEVYAVNFSFQRNDESSVNAELLLNGQNSNIHLPDTILAKYSVHTLLKELPVKIKKKFDFAVHVMFKSIINETITDHLTSINAKI